MAKKEDIFRKNSSQDVLRELRLALLHVLGLGAGSCLPAEVHGDAHEEAAFVEEVAGDVHAHQQQEEDDDEDAHDGARPQAGAAGGGACKGRRCRGAMHENDGAKEEE